MSYRHIQKIVMLCVAITIGLLSATDKLTLYVHPRYVLFTTVMVVLSLILSFFSNDLTSNTEKQPKNYKKTIFATLLIVFMLLLPAQTLSQRVASNRQQSVTQNMKTNIFSYDAFTRDFRHFDLQDWSTYLASHPSPEIIEGKEAIIQGFIYRTDTYTGLARFRLSCCAVDATPLTIELVANDSISQLTDGMWYEISGSFIFDSQRGVYQLQANKITAIDAPKEPYVY